MPRLLPVMLLAGATLLSQSVFAEKVTVEVLQGELDHPWAVAFMPDNKGMLITERSGQLRFWQQGTGLSEPIKGVPGVWAQRQGGLLDVVLAPDFADSRRVWLTWTEADQSGNVGAVVGYGKLSDDNRQLEGFRTVLRQDPKLSGGANLGARMAFDREGFLYVTFGDNFRADTAQELTSLAGKVVRLNADGSVPADNPFVNKPGARPEIWSYGVRNPQGLAFNPWTQEIWENEHGPRGGDEVNIPRKGKNYGWPLATYGIDYSGEKVPGSQGATAPGTEQPVYYWKVSPAISGMAFYNSARFPQWKNALFIGALKDKSLIQLSVNGDRVKEKTRLLKDRNARVRDVRMGPDGYLYVLTDSDKGQLLKVGLDEPTSQ